MPEEELHAEADAQEGSSCGDDLADDRRPDRARAAGPSRARGADAGEDDRVGAATPASASDVDGHVGAGGFERAADGAQIPGSIVDDGESRRSCEHPFRRRDVIWVAAHARVAAWSASAPALKIASAA